MSNRTTENQRPYMHESYLTELSAVYPTAGALIWWQEAEIERLRAEIDDLKAELRTLNEGTAHNARLDRDEIERWKEVANGRE